MKIRRYTDRDWESVKAIYNLSKPDELRGSVDLRAFTPLEKDSRSLRLFRESRVVVVEDGHSILGFGGNDGNYISWLFVHPEHRRRGIGKLILYTLLNRLTGTIKLNVFKNNRAARALYQNAGFKIDREFTGNMNGYTTRAMMLRLEKSNRLHPKGTRYMNPSTVDQDQKAPTA